MMVPLEEYATVKKNDTLFDAVMALEAAQQRRNLEKHQFMHRAVLVLGDKGEVVGKIGHIDVLRALEPRYKNIGDTKSIARAGFSPEFIRSMMETYHLCDSSLVDMCAKSARIKVKDFMYTPEEGEKVDAEASLCEAIHQFVMTPVHLGLLVVKEGKIVGILRRTDVFMTVFGLMKECELKGEV
ncbi:MAG: CBS domain-containing protein [Desulfobacterales bacterium]